MNTYDLIYSGLSESDRNKMQHELEELMAKAIENAKPNFFAHIGRAVKELCDQVGFWGEWVRENGSEYEFIKTLRDGIWKSMLSTEPKKECGEYALAELITAWRKRFPEQWAEVVNAEVAKENTQLRDSLEFERRCNRRY